MGSYLLYEKSTLKEISELLGRETIDSLNQSENRGAQTSHGLSYQKLGKELMTQDEIAVMDGGKCILKLRGVRPFFSDKYDITKHPRYRYYCRFCHSRQGGRESPRPHSADHAGNGRNRKMASQEPEGL